MIALLMNIFRVFNSQHKPIFGRFHLRGIPLIGPYFARLLSISHILLLKINKNYFPQGLFNSDFFPLTTFFYCALPKDCL